MDEESDAGEEEDDVEDKGSVVVDANAVVQPWDMVSTDSKIDVRRIN